VLNQAGADVGLQTIRSFCRRGDYLAVLYGGKLRLALGLCCHKTAEAHLPSGGGGGGGGAISGFFGVGVGGFF